MEEIVKEIASKAGINADQSKLALDTVLQLLKAKMPEALGSQLEGLLAGKELNISSVVKEVSADKLEDLKESASDKLDDLKDSFKKLF
ncbi:MAG: hypothetical protein MUF42_05640 [Cytophagaceae bacterium]|nr:hypothetical protein [Cytophagaceae bacterium]